MKYSIFFRAFGYMLNHMTAKATHKNKKAGTQVMHTYRAIVERAADIGTHNTLLSSYALAAYFIAMNRENKTSPEENYQLLKEGMKSSKLLKAFLGDAKSYFSEKKMAARRDWAALTHDPDHCRKYPNDWVVDVVENEKDFVFGFNYTQCGVCKLCAQEGCPELASYLCRLDFMLVELIGIHLKRTKTLADGGDCCDFRFYS